MVNDVPATRVQVRQRLDEVTHTSYHSAWAEGVHVKVSVNCDTTAAGDMGKVLAKEPGGGGVNRNENTLFDVPPLASVTVTVTE